MLGSKDIFMNALENLKYMTLLHNHSVRNHYSYCSRTCDSNNEGEACSITPFGVWCVLVCPDDD